MDSFAGHSGTVYKVRTNPYTNNFFLTCSEDWSIRLWSTKLVLNIAGPASDDGGGGNDGRSSEISRGR